MYIYLDTAQLSHISHIDKDYHDEFFRECNQKNIKLCLSLQHLQEIAALKDRQSRQDRLSRLQDFNSLYFWFSSIRCGLIRFKGGLWA
jgi:hypothetical protein